MLTYYSWEPRCIEHFLRGSGQAQGPTKDRGWVASCSLLAELFHLHHGGSWFDSREHLTRGVSETYHTIFLRGSDPQTQARWWNRQPYGGVWESQVRLCRGSSSLKVALAWARGIGALEHTDIAYKKLKRERVPSEDDHYDGAEATGRIYHNHRL